MATKYRKWWCKSYAAFYDHLTHRFATICKLGKVRACLEETQRIDEIMNSVPGVYGMIMNQY